MTLHIHKRFGHGGDVSDEDVSENADGQGQDEPIAFGNDDAKFEKDFRQQWREEKDAEKRYGKIKECVPTNTEVSEPFD